MSKTPSRVPVGSAASRPGLAARALILTLAAAALAGCARRTDDFKATSPLTDGYRDRHPIVLAEGTETIDLPVSGAQSQLTRGHREIVKAFADDARQTGANFIQVMVPRGSGNEHAAARLLPDVRAALAAGGMGRGVVVQPYPADGIGAAPIRLAYPKIKAKVAGPCGQWPDDLGQNMQNTDYHDFGCSYQTNLAAIVADPTDLVTPSAGGSVDHAKRQAQLSKWRQLESPATQYEEEQPQIVQIGN